MKVEVNYTKDVACCKECPYYFQEHDMGATIPICTKSKEITILSNPNIIPNDCPIDAIKVKPFDTSSIGKENKCNCVAETYSIAKDRSNGMDRKDIKMFLLHCENMYILKMLGADDEFIKRLEQRWKDNEEDINKKKDDNH